MEENKLSSNRDSYLGEEPPFESEKGVLAGKDLSFYFKIIRIPVVLAIVIEILAHFTANTFYLIWLVNFIVFVYISWYLIKKHQAPFFQIVVASTMAGIIIGVCVALFKLIWFRHFYLIFNLITEPMITAIVGIGISALTFLIIKNISQKNIKKSKKINNNLKNKGSKEKF